MLSQNNLGRKIKLEYARIFAVRHIRFPIFHSITLSHTIKFVLKECPLLQISGI